MEMKEAIKWTEQRMGLKIKPLGFDHREIDNFVVNVLYYSVEYVYSNSMVEYRYDVFVNGVGVSGGIIS